MEKRFNVNQYGSESLGVVADWTHALNNNGELGDVLQTVMSMAKMDAAMIVRLSKTDNKTHYITRCSSQNGKVWTVQPRTCADAILGQSITAAKSGSIWKLSEADSDGLNAASLYRDDYANGLVEAIICPLDSSSGHIDYLEFHFRHRPADHDLNLVIMMIGTLVTSWKRRAIGIISKKLGQKLKLTQNSGEERISLPILDIENPAQLSRSEFRVCKMLSDGMTVNLIAETLSIGQATVRSHLSSIFSKTNVSTQVELLHRLNGKIVPTSECESERTANFG